MLQSSPLSPSARNVGVRFFLAGSSLNTAAIVGGIILRARPVVIFLVGFIIPHDGRQDWDARFWSATDHASQMLCVLSS